MFHDKTISRGKKNVLELIMQGEENKHKIANLLLLRDKSRWRTREKAAQHKNLHYFLPGTSSAFWFQSFFEGICVLLEHVICLERQK